MPDWTYRTLLAPALRALPRTGARRFVLRSLALLARLPAGSRVLEFFGHMRPDPRLRTEAAGFCWPTPVGIGTGLDPDGTAYRAWTKFGVGFVETSADADVPEARFPTWVRLAAGSVEALQSRIARHRESAVGFVLEMSHAASAASRLERIRAAMVAARDGPPRRLLVVAIDARTGWAAMEKLVAEGLEEGADGVRLETGWDFETDSLDVPGPETRGALPDMVRRLRDRFGSGPLVIAGGCETPADVLAVRRAGADLVVLDSGLVRSGPGLPKRANAALLFDRVASTPPPAETFAEPWSRQCWFWCALLGAAMLVGGFLALAIASTRVLLPYDEVWCGTTRAGLEAINPRLLPFMSHDRVSLAGTMISIGGLYLGLALGAVREGAHWARKAVVTSATSGFFSFFLFLGFGYFDPFHAFVTAILFQFLLMAMYAPLGTFRPMPYPELEENGAWRRGQWGQLLFVLLGVGLVGAGIVIASIGSSWVFVREDLAYLGTSIEALRAANPRLIPVVAHDRASLGGMLIANGLGVWLAAQWGFVGGARWLWWTLVGSGTPAFAGAIGVHFAVGYNDPWHLAPAFVGAAVFVLASVLSRRWLCHPESSRRAAWRAVTAGEN